jgi:hypothetical protein
VKSGHFLLKIAPKSIEFNVFFAQKREVPGRGKRVSIRGISAKKFPYEMDNIKIRLFRKSKRTQTIIPKLNVSLW